MDLPVIPTPGGLRQIQGWCPPFSGITFNGITSLHGPNIVAFTGHNANNSTAVIGGDGTPVGSGNGHSVLSDPYCHLDLANFLPADIIKTIRSRGYVDFAKLLPANMEDPVAEVNTQQVASIGGSACKPPQKSQ